MNFVLRASSVVVLLLVGAIARGADAEDRAEPARAAVLAVVQKFFDGMTAADAEASRATLLADGQYYSLRSDLKGVVLRRRTHEEYLAGLGKAKERLLERIWDPKVTVQDRIATVWAPYDFHRDGKFSHGGVDVFTLVRTEDGWKIAGLVFTVDQQSPSKHPAGPPPALKSQ
jgi:hypothetical protein